MTLEEAKELVQKGTASGNIQMIQEGLEAMKALQQPNVHDTSTYIAPITRRKSDDDKNYARREPINLGQIKAFNMFSDDGTEHVKDKLADNEKGAWKTAARETAVIEVDVACGNCGTKYSIHPSLYKKPEKTDDGTILNRNICDDCIRKRAKR